MQCLPRAAKPARPERRGRTASPTVTTATRDIISFPRPIRHRPSIRINCQPPAPGAMRRHAGKPAFSHGFPLFQIASHNKADFATAYKKDNCLGCHQGAARPRRIGTDQRAGLPQVPPCSASGRRHVGGHASHGGQEHPTDCLCRRIDLSGRYRHRPDRRFRQIAEPRIRPTQGGNRTLKFNY